MTSKMLMNTIHPEESRVALIEDGVLQELEVEYSGKQLSKGNIYKGIITRIEPSIHALFVDYGGDKHGFLSYSEVHPSYYHPKKDGETAENEEKPTIEKNMKAGQQLMVQIVKDGRDHKGAYLTTYISLAGRYLVLMPGSKKGGVSRKIEDEAERFKLKEILSQLSVPDDMAIIIRTAGMGRTKAELKKDLNNQVRVWNNIKRKDRTYKAPSLIYQERDLIIRTIRDYFSSDISEILVDSNETYKKVKEFMRIIMPRSRSRVKLHQDKTPLFSNYDLESQIDSIYASKVSLKSGGSIVIDPTEALVSIDVNSGKSRGEKNIEETAFKTNIEAATEIARQLRLRDLGGLIVLDFIDMRQKKNISQVEKTLKTALKRDKARILVGKISKFGLLEMSRQRIKSSIIERSFIPCSHCGGSGSIKSIESHEASLLRKIHGAVMGGDVEKMDIIIAEEIANDLQNRRREEIFNIEKEFNVNISIKDQSGLPVNSFTIETIKRTVPLTSTKPAGEETAAVDTLKEKPHRPERRNRKRKSNYRGGKDKKPAVAKENGTEESENNSSVKEGVKQENGKNVNQNRKKAEEKKEIPRSTVESTKITDKILPK